MKSYNLCTVKVDICVHTYTFVCLATFWTFGTFLLSQKRGYLHCGEWTHKFSNFFSMNRKENVKM